MGKFWPFGSAKKPSLTIKKATFKHPKSHPETLFFQANFHSTRINPPPKRRPDIRFR